MIRQAKITMAAGALATGLLGALLPATVSHATVRPNPIARFCDYTVVVDQAAVYQDPSIYSQVIKWEPQGTTAMWMDGYVPGEGANFENLFGGYVKTTDLYRHDCG